MLRQAPFLFDIAFATALNQRPINAGYDFCSVLVIKYLENALHQQRSGCINSLYRGWQLPVCGRRRGGRGSLSLCSGDYQQAHYPPACARHGRWYLLDNGDGGVYRHMLDSKPAGDGKTLVFIGAVGLPLIAAAQLPNPWEGAV